MTSLSNGIFKPGGEVMKNLSELPLESFSPPVKKGKEPIKKRSVVHPSDENAEAETKKTGKNFPENSFSGNEAELRNALLSVEEEKKKAEFIVKEARFKVKEILDRAQNEAEALKKEASKEGYTEGWNRGFKEGQEKAYEEAEKERTHQNQEFHDSLSQALSSVEREKDACLKRYLDELKNLAVSVGEKVIRVSLKSNGDVIRRMIEGETEKLKKMAWVRIYMEHTDYETMIQADEEVLTHLARLSDNVKFVVMEDGTGGSCIIEMPDEIIDMSVDTQMENIRKLVGNVCF